MFEKQYPQYPWKEVEVHMFEFSHKSLIRERGNPRLCLCVRRGWEGGGGYVAPFVPQVSAETHPPLCALLRGLHGKLGTQDAPGCHNRGGRLSFSAGGIFSTTTPANT